MSNVLENKKDVKKKSNLWCCLFCSTANIGDGLQSGIFNYLFTYDMKILWGNFRGASVLNKGKLSEQKINHRPGEIH